MTSRTSIRRRGQPLIALVLLMVSWVGARAAMWEAPRIVGAGAQNPAPVARFPAQPVPRRPLPPRVVLPPPQSPPAALSATAENPLPVTAPTIVAPSSEAAAPAAPQPGSPSPHRYAQPSKGLSAEDAADHQDLFSAAMNLPTVEQGVAMDTPRRPRSALPAAVPAAQGSPWSGDAWLLLRGGGNSYNAPGSGLAGVVIPAGFYGGSQGGAVLRYRLALLGALQPMLYVRATSGIERPRGEELAAGLSVRPVRRWPIAVMGEGRVTRTSSGVIARPAGALVTLLPPLRLPLALRGTVYLQAGYAGGRGSTAFIDGQARLEKPMLQTGRIELRAGGGLWGGAQRGANRADLGPTASLAVPIGPAGSTVSVDYRFRVAGRAAPGSGAVVTLSAGF